MTYVKFMFKGKEWSIDAWLASQLDSIAYNLDKDWDFVILISGDRSVRVGKSVLGMAVCAYLAYAFKRLGINDDAYNLSDVYFDNKPMMDQAQKKPKYSINHYDEGREGLAAIKAMREFQQDIMDFFAECGQLNHVFVIVCPDFFELKEEIAVGRSELLLNVYRKADTKEMDIYKEGMKRPVTIFRRGFFEFFSRKKKADLYDRAKTMRKKNYGLIKCDFFANFPNQYPLGEEEYKKMKREALERFGERHKEQRQTPNQVKRDMRDAYVRWRRGQGIAYADIKEELPKVFDKVADFELIDLSERQLKRIAGGVRT